MKSLTSLLGWAFLLAVLAVPSFLFYNWWEKSRQQASAEMTQEAAPADIFPSSEKSRPAPPPAGPGKGTPQPPAASERPGAQPAPEPAPQQPPLISSAPVQPAPSAAGALKTGPVPAQPRLVSYYRPKSDRDPTFSPEDYSRLKEAELRRLEAEEQRRLAESRKPKEPAFESRLRLQGIIGTAAIINGEMYSAGQTINGAKILKVGSNYIIGEYKGRKFRKVLR
ncbi:MAG TPA: hypothetical protein DCS63_10415 [Elusimicrobia bacterium]|nr:hypothetical protein [Elusimicrobiota bacterium]